VHACWCSKVLSVWAPSVSSCVYCCVVLLHGSYMMQSAVRQSPKQKTTLVRRLEANYELACVGCLIEAA
jgi:hypothetical protein